MSNKRIHKDKQGRVIGTSEDDELGNFVSNVGAALFLTLMEQMREKRSTSSPVRQAPAERPVSPVSWGVIFLMIAILLAIILGPVVVAAIFSAPSYFSSYIYSWQSQIAQMTANPTIRHLTLGGICAFVMLLLGGIGTIGFVVAQRDANPHRPLLLAMAFGSALLFIACTCGTLVSLTSWLIAR